MCLFIGLTHALASLVTAASKRWVLARIDAEVASSMNYVKGREYLSDGITVNMLDGQSSTIIVIWWW